MRCNPQSWKLILQLLPASGSAGIILKKHNLLQLVSKTFSEAALLSVAATAVDLGCDTKMIEEKVYRMSQQVLLPPSFRPVEREPKVAGMTSAKIQELLKYVNAVLLYLQGNWATGSREGNVVTVLRGTPEIGAQILGSYLEVCAVLAQSASELGEDWTSTVVNVWRSCVWGNPNLKKVRNCILVSWFAERKPFCFRLLREFSCRRCSQPPALYLRHGLS